MSYFSIKRKIEVVIGRILMKSFKKSGRGSYIIKPLRIIGEKYASFGNNTTILNGLRLELYSNDKKVILKVGNNVNIEQNVHITGAEAITIGDNCSILGGVLITDITHPYNEIEKAAKYQSIKTNPVTIGDDCFIGMGARIMPGVTLGKHVVVGANSVVVKNVSDYSVVAGIPAKIIRKYDKSKHEWIRVEE